MKEFPTEEQARLAVLWLSIGVTLAGLGYGFWKGRKVSRGQRKALLLDSLLFALAGPAIWGFWNVYNSIEDRYGLDSLKALKINFFIAVGLGVSFVGLRVLAARFFPEPQPVSSPKKSGRKR